MKANTIVSIDESASNVDEDDVSQDSSVLEADIEDTTEAEDAADNGDDGEAEEEDRVAELGQEEEVVDQEIINRQWIKSLDCNYPLRVYYKNFKKNLLIILGSERISSRRYPAWSNNLYLTFQKLTACVHEIYFVYQNCGLD